MVGRKGPDDIKTLHMLKFVIGDYIDLAVYSKGPKEHNEGANSRLNKHHSF